MFSTDRLDEPQPTATVQQGEREEEGQILPQNQSLQPPLPLCYYSAKADIFTRTTAHCLDKCGIL